ncbi:hypothetical protein CR513_33310, partial [Mucuna pruriens]
MEKGHSTPRCHNNHFGWQSKCGRIGESRKRKACNVLAVRRKADITPTLVITFSERDMRYEPPRQDKPMSIDLEACAGKLYDFANKQVTIKGVIELETTFEERTYIRTIPMLYTVIDVDASYNIIMGRPGLKKLGAMVSTLHLCMKYPMGQEVGRVWVDHRIARRCYEDNLRIGSQPSQAGEPNVNVLDLNLDPRCEGERERPLPTEDLKEVSIGPKSAHKTKLGTTLAQEDESCLVAFLQENKDVFAWSPTDMLGIDQDFLCHHLLISLG